MFLKLAFSEVVSYSVSCGLSAAPVRAQKGTDRTNFLEPAPVYGRSVPVHIESLTVCAGV